VRRLSLWLRRHPVVFDSVIALLLAMTTIGESHVAYVDHVWLFYWLVAALMVVPVAFRRRWPVAAAYLIAGGGLVQLLTHSASESFSMLVSTCDITLAIALYTLVVYTDRRRYLAYAALLLAGTVTYVILWVPDGNTAAALLVGSLLIYGFAWVFGEFIGARRAYHAEVEARVKLLENERDQQARIAVAVERTRIARELHDVVAHAVSVIVVQADGAGYAIRGNPDLAEAAVRTISETGREALVELRQLLEVLRNDTDEREVGRSPQPGLSGLRELVDKVTAVGLPVALTVRGDLATLPAAVGLGIYRIVQESLTNSIKHAGPGAAAAVRVERVGGLVEVEVEDNGGRVPQLTAAVPARQLVSGGNGLIGMRERAIVLGGTLVAGPAPHGGWQVRATFPVGASHDVEVR
jgi:signal transduction histidine kinase